MSPDTAAPPRAAEAAGPVSVSMTVNGRSVTVEAPSDERLSRLLRDRLALTGTKVGCDAGDCGACTVLVEGRQVCACLTAAAQVDGRSVTTVEGLADSPVGRALQAAFLAHGAAQCGICTPGMLVAAAELLATNPAPDDRAAMDALGGVLCRCTGYRKIVEAVVDAPRFLNRNSPAAEVDGPSAYSPSVGTRWARPEGRGKLDGTERFGADIAPEDCLWLRVVRSPHARARFTLGDIAGLHARWPGLARVLTAADVPGHNAFGIYPRLKDQPVLAERAVRFRGEAVVALVGDRATVEAIPDADVPIDWHPETPVTGLEAARRAEGPVHAGTPDNVLIRGLVKRGDPEAGFAGAAATAEGAWTTSFVEHAYVEPEAGFARRLEDGRIEIVATTQTPYMDRDEIAHVLGIAADMVHIVPTACGGGFGGKLDLSIQPLVATAAWVLDRPVRVVYGRTESMTSTTKRHPAAIAARMAADAEGRLVAFDFEGDFNTGAYASWGPTVAGRVPVHATGPYRVPAVHARSCAWYTNETPAGAFRGFGVPQASLAHEGLLDDLSERLGIDRLEIRRRNALGAGDLTATGQRLEHSCGLVACLDALAPRWTALLADAEAANRAPGPLRRGVGIGCMWYGIGNTSMSNPSSMRVTLGPDGRLVLWNGAVDIGQGSATIMLQICADAAGLPVGRFDQVVGDTAVTEDAGKTSASRQTFVSGKAAYLAGRDLRAALLRLTNAGPEARLAIEGRLLHVSDDAGESYMDLTQLETFEGPDGRPVILEGRGTFDPPTEPLDENGQGVPYATYGFAAQIAAATVDTDLGTVRVDRIVAAHDVGRAINPMLVEGQIHGGIAQGLGLALMEEYLPGVTENLHDYLIPTFGDMPEIEIHLVEDTEPLGPFGAKGIGEPALVPTAPAILSAIRHATGVAVRHVPVLPHRLHAALRATGAEGGR
ncbi:MAG: molybdopterin-dependent oxidoreductase [Azospirillaceae bacterium]